MQVEIRQIAYNESTKKLCDPSRIIFNEKSDKFLENKIIAKHAGKIDADYIGIFSARFEQKMKGKLPKKTIQKTIKIIEDDNFNFPVYSFFGGHTRRNVWEVAERWQPGIIECAQFIFNEFDPEIDILLLDTPIVYQNAFVATKEVYMDYVNTWLKPLMKIMTGKVIASMLDKNSKYKGAKLSNEECVNVFGKPYYTYHPFVCERFFSTYCAVKGIEPKQL